MNDIVAIPTIEQINLEHRLAQTKATEAVQHAINCGEMLLQIKASKQHGEWLPWLNGEIESGRLQIKIREMQNYMRLASNTQRVAYLQTPSIRAALELLSDNGAEEQQQEEMPIDVKADRKPRIKGQPSSLIEQLEQIEKRVKPSLSKNYITLDEWNAGERWHGGRSSNPMNEQNDKNIEWAAWSWNPVTGCLHNCDYCYARDIATRFYPYGFKPAFIPERLDAPANTKQGKPRWENDIGYRNVFTCSMADLFGKWVPNEWIKDVIKTVERNPQWTFLLLTKFPARMTEFTYPPNVWLGTTVDRQHTVNHAENAFYKIKETGFSGVCWVSCEPILERLTFNRLDMFDWVVMGGASKSTQTPAMQPPFDDIVTLYEQARSANCKVYMKTNLGIEQRIREYPSVIQKSGTSAKQEPTSYISHIQKISQRDAQEKYDNAVRMEKEAQEKLDKAKKMLQSIITIMTEEEFNFLRGFVHPDKHPGNEEKANKAFNLVIRLSEKIDPNTPASILRRHGWPTWAEKKSGQRAKVGKRAKTVKRTNNQEQQHENS